MLTMMACIRFSAARTVVMPADRATRDAEMFTPKGLGTGRQKAAGRIAEPGVPPGTPALTL
ncbi:hypothetical protein [Rhizobium mesoamericanum]|uniref:Uncharacterized protein n=1 Tax=Rhizobium mesoamericanum STM3625 TaxID=1211777 RepID=K0PYI7_9HYPH|nr:hypothetical protein [Rhizobium mesoamericanum]CCM76765.1 hypothetical protein BN77_3798 [Rhizobium mesoamericanum STM3625]